MLVHTYHVGEVLYLCGACTQVGPQSLHTCPAFIQSGPISYARSFLRMRVADPVLVGSVSSYRLVVSVYLTTAGHVQSLHRYSVIAHRGHRQVRS